MSKSAANHAQPAPIPGSEPALAKILLLLVSGYSLVAIHAAAQQQLGLAPPAIDALIAQGRRLITLAADWHRDEQIGKAITRLEQLYAQNMAAKELAECRQVQAQLNKLLGLYAPGGGGTEAAGDSAEQLAAVRGHLQPLGLAAPETPLEELARLAATEIIQLRGSQQ